MLYEFTVGRGGSFELKAKYLDLRFNESFNVWIIGVNRCTSIPACIMFLIYKYQDLIGIVIRIEENR